MARVLLVGIAPEETDFSDPALPAGLDADKVRLGIARALDDLRAAGHDARHFYLSTGPSGVGELAARLAREPVDCVVVGGGVRLPPRNLPLFEAVLNTVARCLPAPAIALNGRPDEATLAVARVLGGVAGSESAPA